MWSKDVCWWLLRIDRAQPPAPVGSRHDHMHTGVDCCMSSFGSVVMIENVSSGTLWFGSFHDSHKPANAIGSPSFRAMANACLLLPFSSSLLPPVEGIRWHKTRTTLERFTEYRCSCHCLCSCIDRREPNLRVFSRMGNQSPPQSVSSRSPVSRFKRTTGWKVWGATL
jgi:hypothetical protein